MKTIHGDVPAPLTVREDLAISGTLREGATVLQGCSLLVRGNFRGTLTLERRARLILGGTLGAFVDRNEGTLSVAGEIATPLEMVPGVVTVAVGTAVILDGRSAILTVDGSMHPATGTTDISLSRTAAFTWDAASASFASCDTSDFIELARTFWPASS
ncbi:hypothetical protein [Curtobacterium sp. L1-20]|uniref:hypothetical protein n=1 Tax=Curtobacterium sp. L1-20 TaxID=3138181 RepID=UPI003B52CF75